MLGLIATTAAGAWAFAAPLPPGRQYRLTMVGTNTVTFLPQAGLPPARFDYKVKVEYIVDARYGKEAKADEPDKAPDEEATPKKAPAKKASPAKRAKAKEAEAAKVTGAVDLSLHSSELAYRQDGRPILETRVGRSRFQGRLQPDSPAFDVTSKDAPPRLQEALKNFDVVAATLRLDDDLKVVDRKYRFEGGQRALVETLLSIHAPIPRGVESWESPTQLALGHGQAARGKLRFEVEKRPATGPSTDLVKVKVSGVLKAEGVVAGQFIKDGTYTVSGEQTFDSHTHEWTSALWSVAVVNELANQAGQAVAQAKGTLIVDSRAVEAAVPKP